MTLLLLSLSAMGAEPYRGLLLPEEVARYESNMQLGRTGVRLSAAGTGMMAGGLLLAAQSVNSNARAEAVIGGLVIAAGGATMNSVGVPMAVAGSLSAARVLDEAGLDVPTTAGAVGGLLFIVPGATAVGAGAQLSVNQRTFEGSRREVSLRLVPDVRGRGIRLIGVF